MGMTVNAQRDLRTCSHCGESYQPRGNRSRFCEPCLGPSVETKWGKRWPFRHRLERYGVSYPEWIEMVARYDGACWVCREQSAEHLDHDHKTGDPRGAVCAICNTRLAVLDNERWLDQASAYLAERWL